MVKLITLLASLPIVAFGAPSGFFSRPVYLPREARSVALDEDRGRLIAFDNGGKEIGVFAVNATLARRGTGTCTPMSNDDIDHLPGIQRLRDEATKNWGKGKRNEVVNDKALPGSPANVCADDAGVVLIYDGDPSCKDLTNEASGTLEGGKIYIENNEGISMSSTTEVTKQSSFSVGRTVSAKFSFPGIAEVSSEISTTGTWTNTQGHSETVSQDQRTLQRIEQPVDEGQQCEVRLTTRSCSIVGKGSLKMIASGMLWFEYEKKTKGHYKWGLVMEAILPNVNDRSSTVDFKATGNIDSSSHFSSSGCTK